jgi:hypothetical protein
MAQNLNQRGKQRVKRMSDSLENINKMLNRLNRDELETLVRRDQIPITPSYGGSSSFATGRSGGGKSSSSIVETAVIANIEGRKIYDPLRDNLRKIEKKIIDAEEAIRQVQELIKGINDPVEKKRSTQTSEPCEICMVLPVVKTAMCIPCYQDWVLNGAPDRFKWKAYKRQITSSEGIPLVTEQPAPRRAV